MNVYVSPMSVESKVSVNRNCFKSELHKLKYFLQKYPMNKSAFDECILYAFKHEEQPCDSKRSFQVHFKTFIVFLVTLVKFCVSVVLLIGFIYLLATTHNATQKFIMRKSQDFIYPVMRSIRFWTLPVLQRFETLSGWHEEECLLQNPFHHELPLDCWPCEDVRTMVDLTGLYNYSKAYVYNGKPFLVRDVMDVKFTLEDFEQMYKVQKAHLDSGSTLLSSLNLTYQTLNNFIQELPSLKLQKHFHIVWKINRVAAARVLRKTFHRPYFVPNTSEVALQRFLCISGSEAPQFFLPKTDFANVWIAQGHGYRLIVLDPSESCRHNCSVLSVLLRPQDVLYYNWQFWIPRSLPARLSEDPSVTYIGSFY